ncbi:hypothetical protein KC343_g45 [Hortaea werneckii]|nr:hypothetical protein KC343_g45 [Hortaea werneckii]
MAPATTPTTPAAEPANAKPVGFAPESDVLEESEVDAALFESLGASVAQLAEVQPVQCQPCPFHPLRFADHLPDQVLPGHPSPPHQFVHGPRVQSPVLALAQGPHPSWSPRPKGPYPLPAAQPGAPPWGPPCPPFGPQPHGAPVVMVLQELATLLSAAGSGRTRRPRSSRMRSRIVGSRLVAVAALPVAGGSLGTGGGEAGEEGGGGDGALHCGWYCVYTKLVEEDGKCRSSNDNGDNSPNDIYLIPRNADMLTSQAESQKRGMSGTARFVSMLSPTNTVFAFARHHQVCSHAGQRDHHGDLTRKVERLLEPSHPIEPRSPGDGISTTSSSTPFGFHSPGSTSSIVN